MSQCSRVNSNLEQFKQAIQQTDNKINVIFFPANSVYKQYFTTSVVVENTTHILYTQKNELRRFKRIEALVSALELNHKSPALNLLITA